MNWYWFHTKWGRWTKPHYVDDGVALCGYRPDPEDIAFPQNDAPDRKKCQRCHKARRRADRPPQPHADRAALVEWAEDVLGGEEHTVMMPRAVANEGLALIRTLSTPAEATEPDLTQIQRNVAAHVATAAWCPVLPCQCELCEIARAEATAERAEAAWELYEAQATERPLGYSIAKWVAGGGIMHAYPDGSATMHDADTRCPECPEATERPAQGEAYADAARYVEGMTRYQPDEHVRALGKEMASHLRGLAARPPENQ